MTDAAAGDTARAAEESRLLERVIGVLLRTGVVASLIIVVTGLVLSFAHHPEYMQSRSMLGQITTPGRVVPHSLREVLAGALALKGEAVIALGLLLLIATPVLRVAVALLAFALERDRPFTLITAFVLAMLVLSFFLGKVEG